MVKQARSAMALLDALPRRILDDGELEQLRLAFPELIEQAKTLPDLSRAMFTVRLAEASAMAGAKGIAFAPIPPEMLSNSLRALEVLQKSPPPFLHTALKGIRKFGPMAAWVGVRVILGAAALGLIGKLFGISRATMERVADALGISQALHAVFRVFTLGGNSALAMSLAVGLVTLAGLPLLYRYGMEDRNAFRLMGPKGKLRLQKALERLKSCQREQSPPPPPSSPEAEGRGKASEAPSLEVIASAALPEMTQMLRKLMEETPAQDAPEKEEKKDKGWER